MRNDRINYVVVGGFVLAMGAALLVTIAVLAGRTGATDTYYTEYRNVTGLAHGTQVLADGLPVGQVETIEPVREEGSWRYRLELSVRKGWPIPEDSVAKVTAPGLLAATAIDIQGGESPALIEPGGTVPGEEPVNAFAVVSDVAGNLNDLTETQIKPLLETLAERLPIIVANLEAFSVQIQETGQLASGLLSPENAAYVQRILANLEATSDNVSQLSGDLAVTRAEVQRILEGVGGLIERNEGLVEEAVLDMHYSLESVARHIDSVNENLEGTSRNMNEFSRQLRNNPGALLSGRPPGDEAAGGSGAP